MCLIDFLKTYLSYFLWLCAQVKDSIALNNLVLQMTQFIKPKPLFIEKKKLNYLTKIIKHEILI